MKEFQEFILQENRKDFTKFMVLRAIHKIEELIMDLEQLRGAGVPIVSDGNYPIEYLKRTKQHFEYVRDYGTDSEREFKF